MRHYIRFFKKGEDELAGEIPVYIDIDILKKKYCDEVYDPMLYYSYLMKPDDTQFLLQYLKHYKFDFSNFDYYLECYS